MIRLFLVFLLLAESVLATTTFLEPGTDATQDLSFYVNGSTGTIGTATDQKYTGPCSLKAQLGNPSTTAIARGPDASLADAGTRVSFWFRFDSLPAASAIVFFGTNTSNQSVFQVVLNSTGNLVMTPVGATAATGSQVLAVNTWHHVVVAYTVTNTTTFRFQLYLDGIAEANATAGTLTRTGSSRCEPGAGNGFPINSNVWFDDIYTDNIADYSDTGAIRVTSKRPFANGTVNGFSGTGVGSGYGSGNAVYVNEQPLSQASYVSIITVATAITEEYNIEKPPTGDVNIHGQEIIDICGWIFTKSLTGETVKLRLKNVDTNETITSTPAMYTAFAGSKVYPAGTGTDIGMVTDNTTATTVTLYECGVLIAYRYPGFFFGQ